jgi:uncharacterized protein YfkK (UPF0435 family)
MEKEELEGIKIDLKCAERDLDVLMARHLKNVQKYVSDGTTISGEMVEELYDTYDYVKKLKQRLSDAEIELLTKEYES